MAITFSKENTFTSQKKGQKILIGVFGAVALITAFVLWQGFSGSQDVGILSVPPISVLPRQAAIDFSILEQKKLFESFLQAPPAVSLPENVGRPNPFAPL
ncbi:MAG: hypothetical protein HYS60_00250 [Candidatus Wildermuthbacteria bacterium]|nr:hypothetical protein [Candidatus Wildermuthbacteria bacterium]